MLAILLASALLVQDAPPASPRNAPGPEEMARYREQEAKAGRSADAHVRLALWSEQHGLDTERAKHLAMAVAADPGHAVARGLMGFVQDGGRWRRPEALAARPPGESDARSEYEARRAQATDTADSQWKLALWCNQHKLRPQAEAHARATVRLDPSRKAAWEFLGYKKHKGRWATDEEIAAEKAEAKAQARADRSWKPRLVKLREGLRSKAGREAARAELAGVSDPRAVPSIVAVFATRDPADQAALVQMLGQIEGPLASRLLAQVALYGDSAEVRRQAAETLVRRDPREFATLVMEQIRPILKYKVQPGEGPGATGALLIEGEEAIYRRSYVYPSLPAATQMTIADYNAGIVSNINGTPDGGLRRSIAAVIDPALAPLFSPTSRIARAMRVQEQVIANDLREFDRAVASSRAHLAEDVQRIEQMNSEARDMNERARDILTHSTGMDLGPDRRAWARWWSDREGYAFVAPPSQTQKPVVDQPVLSSFQPRYLQFTPATDCFAAGTLIRTDRGPRPVEDLRVGDLVLSQDVATGRLGFEPIVTVYHNPPAATMRVQVGNEPLVVTGIHRFWAAGKGWTMARDLKPGDVVRALGGTSVVKSVEPASTQKVYNLDVARARTFFVGHAATLVHDNTLVDPTPLPFDRAE